MMDEVNIYGKEVKWDHDTNCSYMTIISRYTADKNQLNLLQVFEEVEKS